jgi:hypothetical protein
MTDKEKNNAGSRANDSLSTAHIEQHLTETKRSLTTAHIEAKLSKSAPKEGQTSPSGTPPSGPADQSHSKK